MNKNQKGSTPMLVTVVIAIFVLVGVAVLYQYSLYYDTAVYNNTVPVSTVKNNSTEGNQAQTQIQTGQFSMSDAQLKELQEAQKEGHQPWRSDPKLVLESYGFSKDEIALAKITIIGSTHVLYSMSHYNVDLKQPIFGIWIVTSITNTVPPTFEFAE